MQILSTLKSLITSRLARTTIYTLIGLSMFAGISTDISTIGGVNDTIGISTSYAADAPQKDLTTTTNEMLTSLVSFGNILIGILTFLLTPLIMLAGWLLSPDWTMWDIFNLREVFHHMWILISNIVYTIFAITLVGIAFMNIVGGENAKAYEIKAKLPSLIISILIVPFTWFIVSAVLSISNILTASVIQLPFDMLTKGDGTMGDFMTEKIIPKEITYNKNATSSVETVDSNGKTLTDTEKNATDANGMSTTAYQKNWNFIASDCDDDQNQCLSIQDFLTQWKGGSYNLLSVYAYGIFKIQNYKQIKEGELKGLKTVWQIIEKLSFGLLFFIIFGILLVAIVFALFSRATMLWLFAMFSPLFALNHFFHGNKAIEKSAVHHFSVTHFISLAMVPVYVSAALAFGLMFLGTAMNATGTSGSNGTTKWATGIEMNADVASQTSTFTFWGVTFKTIGLLTEGTTHGLNGALDIGKGIIGTIIMNVLALVILWMAVMAALNADHITEHAVKPIFDMGNEVGKLMQHAPQYIPIPGTGGQSMKSITQWVSNVKWGIDQTAASKAWDITKRFGFEDAAKRNQAKSAFDAAITSGEIESMKKTYHALKGTYSNYNEMKHDAGMMDMLKRLASKTGGNPEAADMTELIKSIDKGMEAKYGGSWLYAKSSSDTDWAAFLQKDVEKKTSGESGKESVNNEVFIKQEWDKLTFHLAPNVTSNPITITKDEWKNPKQVAEKLSKETSINGRFNEADWDNLLKPIIPNEAERKTMIQSLLQHSGLVKKTEGAKSNP